MPLTCKDALYETTIAIWGAEPLPKGYRRFAATPSYWSGAYSKWGKLTSKSDTRMCRGAEKSVGADTVSLENTFEWLGESSGTRSI